MESPPTFMRRAELYAQPGTLGMARRWGGIRLRVRASTRERCSLKIAFSSAR
jgi:hypothetical protein